MENKDTKRVDFLAQLREKEKRSGKISHRDMINHLSNNLWVMLISKWTFIQMLTTLPHCSLVGSDTTAISLRAMVYYIVKTPRVYDKIQNEIDEADRNNQLSKFITYEECLKLPYL